MTLSRLKRACDEGSFQSARTVNSKTSDKMKFCRQEIEGKCAIRDLLRGRKKDG